MAIVARIGDMHVITCSVGAQDCPHPNQVGYCGANYDDVCINGKAITTQDAIGVCNCPHSGTFLPLVLSNTVFVHGKKVAFASQTRCQNMNCLKFGQIVTGSDNVFINA